MRGRHGREVESPMSSVERPPESETLVARTLKRGFSLLRFEYPLEQEFRSTHNRAARPRTRLYVLLALATTLGFAVLDNWMLEPAETGLPNVIRFGLQLPLIVLLIALTDRRRYERWYLQAVQIAAPLFGIGAVLMATQAPPEQVSMVSARLVLVTFFFYFMLGMYFYAALRSNLVVLAGYAIAAAAAGVAAEVAVYHLFILLCANLFAGAGCYALEHANRLAFLERRLLTEVATHDGLTGLLNRSAFEDQVRRAWDQAARDTLPIAVLMIDIDYFKPFNDLYGHQAGDQCLRRVAATVRRTARRRPLDIVARYGGEEFIAVLYGADRRHAENVAQAMRQSVAELRIPHAGSEIEPYLTVSVGVAAALPRRDVSHETLVRLADRALYGAKAGGRNRSVVADIHGVPLEQAPAGAGETLQKAAS